MFSIKASQKREWNRSGTSDWNHGLQRRRRIGESVGDQYGTEEEFGDASLQSFHGPPKKGKRKRIVRRMHENLCEEERETERTMR